MKTIYILLVMIGIIVIAAGMSAAQPVDVTPYAWQFPTISAVQGADDLIADLQEEVQKVITAGHLAPVTFRYGDQIWDSYWMYQEPGRIITTLAWAYPYLTPAQQTSVRAYVANELENSNWAPWGNYPLSRTDGARREYHPLDQIWNATAWMGHYRPYVHTIYGLWLYAYRTNDWALLQSHLADIEDFYNNESDQARTYGSTCADIAMARIEDHFGRTTHRDAALSNLQTHLTNGRDFASVETFLQNGNQGWDAPYGPQYNSRNENLIYHGWMFLNMSPEIGRYLRDYHLSTVSTRNQWAKDRFPLWWLAASQYFCRWTGDESIGLTSEMFGMIVPVERWVLNADAASLRPYFRSTPNCVGDCYWLEALVTAIEAYGTTVWSDVRAPLPVTDLVVNASGNDVLLRWTSTGATSYNIFASTNPDSLGSVILNVTTAQATLTNEVTLYDKRFYRVTSVR